MYSIYTVANTTPTSQKNLLYSSWWTKRKGGGGFAVAALHTAKERVSRSNIQIGVQEKEEVQQKEMQGYHKERGVLENREVGKMSQIRRTGMSYGAMHPWEGRDPGNNGMFTVVLDCFVMDSFLFLADTPISPGLVVLLYSLLACLFRFTLSHYSTNNNKNPKQIKNTTQ